MVRLKEVEVTMHVVSVLISVRDVRVLAGEVDVVREEGEVGEVEEVVEVEIVKGI